MPTREVVVTRKRLFSSAHFYDQKQFSEEQNLAIFGHCHTPYGHGHNYTLEVSVLGQINSNTKMVINLTDLEKILFEVVDPLDHQHLNFDVEHFKTLVPTTENIALYLRDQLLKKLAAFAGLRLASLRLFETDDLWVEILC